MLWVLKYLPSALPTDKFGLAFSPDGTRVSSVVMPPPTVTPSTADSATHAVPRLQFLSNDFEIWSLTHQK